MSVPNQYVITSERSDIIPPFVQINRNEWMEAYKVLNRTELCIYLLLAQNQKGYVYEYSPQAIENLGLMAKGTASKAMQGLIEKGYVVDGKFYTASPQQRERNAAVDTEINNTLGR